MQARRQDEVNGSPAAELVKPIMFIAGLFALMNLISAFF
jgi:hypothetical protein